MSALIASPSPTHPLHDKKISPDPFIRRIGADLCHNILVKTEFELSRLESSQ